MYMCSCSIPDNSETRKQLLAENCYVVTLRIHGDDKDFFLGKLVGYKNAQQFKAGRELRVLQVQVPTPSLNR